jgi:hypothetical protein
MVGSILTSLTSPATIQITTGNLSSNVVGAIGGLNGIFIGNIYQGGGNISLTSGDVTATADACLGSLCLSEITGGKNCVQIANINAPAHCGNSNIFDAAAREIEKLAAEAAAEAKKIADEAAAKAKELADEAAAEASKLANEARNYCSHHWYC